MSEFYFIFSFIYFLIIYSHVHTLFGSFLSPVLFGLVMFFPDSVSIFVQDLP
jgi:hypothetical protein